MDRFKKAFRLFIDFIQFGCFTFGGGWSIVAQMQKKYVDGTHELTGEELVDMTSVARSLPGTMIGNVAMLFGYHTEGLLGAAACIFGMIIPPMLILAVITFFYTAFQTNVWVMSAMAGIRAAVVPIIGSAVLGMVKGAFKLKPCYAVAVLTLVLYLGFNVSCIWLIVIGAVCGVLISEFYERKGGAAK